MCIVDNLFFDDINSLICYIHSSTAISNTNINIEQNFMNKTYLHVSCISFSTANSINTLL
jgi:hypothetical protein